MDDVLNGVISFQSPRSGKFESNVLSSEHSTLSLTMFQSPRSGKFESNALELWESGSYKAAEFQSPRSGKFESNS